MANNVDLDQTAPQTVCLDQTTQKLLTEAEQGTTYPNTTKQKEN